MRPAEQDEKPRPGEEEIKGVRMGSDVSLLCAVSSDHAGDDHFSPRCREGTLGGDRMSGYPVGGITML